MPDPSATSRRAGYRWGRFVARHRWFVIVVWAIVAVGSALSYPALQKSLVGVDFSVPATESSHADQLVARHFRSFGSEQLALTFTSGTATVDRPSYHAAVDAVVAAVRATPGVVGVIDPYEPFMSALTSADKTSAVALVGIDGGPRRRIDISRRLHDLVDERAHGDPSVALTGYSPMTVDLTTVESADASRAESIGIPLALAVLVLALGGLVAGAVPLVATGAGLLAAFGLFALMSNFMSLDALVTTVSSMIGIGLGTDYSLFVVSRFREELGVAGVVSRRDRERVDHAIATATATAGHTVAISGLVVMIALAALTIVDVSAVRSISLVVAVTVTCVLLVAWTLLPAALAILGPGVNALALPRRLRPADSAAGQPGPRWWNRWARHVIGRAWRYTALAALALVLCMIPIGWIRYGVDIGADALAAQSSGRANAILAEKFAPGMISPITIVLTGHDDAFLTESQSRQAVQFEHQVRHDPRVAYAETEQNDGRKLLLVVPSVPIDSTAATDLIGSLRHAAARLTAQQGPDIAVGGTTALVVDASAEISATVPWVIALILGFSLVYLAVVLRSIVIPVKAVLMNLLATGAALGLTVAVFQWGWASSLLGFRSTGFIQVYLPVTVFAVVFGLSMDYEVFLIGRMRESFHRTRDNDAAIVEGIEHTARPITAAAAIMIAVFASFVTADVLELKQFGFALAVAVLFDAVLVRMMLVPAMMKLFGARNWWPGTR